jgi:long-chain fatty acid transport protein
MNRTLTQTGIAAVIAGAAVLTPDPARAAGFALLEQNASGLGNAYAGSAAVAQDASTMFFNPAGLAVLPGMQLVVAGSGIYVQSEFSGTGTDTIPGISVGSGTGGNAGGGAFVPSLYFSMPLGERFAAGIGVGAPFGLRTEYDDGWLGRFQGINSELTTININPSVAFKVNDAISLGAGISWQKAEVELTNAVFLGALGEGRTELSADDDAWGWNLGALFRLGIDTRVGISYRSTLSYTLEGSVSTSTLSGAAPPPGTNFSASADVKFPDMALLSVVQNYGDQWQLLGDVQWTHWSTIGTVNVMNTSSASGQPADQLAFNFEDAWRIAFGVNYFHSQAWTFRGGIAWDQSPVDDDNRTVRLPDNDRYWLSFGAQYKFGKAGALDIGYAHLFVSSPDINRTKPLSINPPLSAFSTTVTGDYSSSVDILGVQFTWTF